MGLVVGFQGFFYRPDLTPDKTLLPFATPSRYWPTSWQASSKLFPPPIHSPIKDGVRWQAGILAVGGMPPSQVPT